MFVRLIAALLFLAFAAPFASAAPYKAEAGPYAVETVLGEWTYVSRERAVPYKIYHAPEAVGPRPVVIFSHGLGGSREGAIYLGEHLASWGYIAVHIQHPGSDESLWRGKVDPATWVGEARSPELLEALRQGMTPSAAAERFRDVAVVIDRLVEMNRGDATFKGRLDLARLGMSGHSYGAVTTLALAGQSFGPGGFFSFTDERIKAAIAYSPNKPVRGDPSDYPTIYGDIRIPIFHMTGTEDKSPLDRDASPEQRLVPYRNIENATGLLLVLEGGDHMVFNGHTRRRAPKPADERHRELIREASIAYWDWQLMGDKAARAWLVEGGFAAELGADGTFETKIRE